jgi:hypothetical protein
MYNLKKIIGIVSFEENKIKLSIIDVKNINEPRYLYFDSREVNYTCDFSSTIDMNEVRVKVIELITNADDFSGIIVKRYVINIPFLKINVQNFKSPNFNILSGYCDKDFKNELFTKTKISNLLNEEISLFDKIIEWDIDGHPYNSYPMNKTGQNISFTYKSFLCSKVKHQSILNLFNNLGIYILGITTNQMFYENNDINIKVNDNATYFYQNNQEIKLNIGINDVFNTLNEKYKMKNTLSMSEMITFISTTSYVKELVPLLNYYDNNYLSYTELNQKSLIKGFEQGFDEFTEVLTEQLTKYCNFNNIIIKGNDNFDNLIRHNIKLKFDKFSVITKDRINTNH